MDVEHYEQGNKFFEKGYYGSALEHYNSALKLKEKEEYYFNRSKAFLYVGDTEHAFADIVAAIKMQDKKDYSILVDHIGIQQEKNKEALI